MLECLEDQWCYATYDGEDVGCGLCSEDLDCYTCFENMCNVGGDFISGAGSVSVVLAVVVPALVTVLA